MTTIYFMRHAEPARSAPAVQSDAANKPASTPLSLTMQAADAAYPLTDKGRADTALVTHFLRGRGVSAVLSSPFLRAVQTVTPFAQEVGLEVEVVPDFRERAVGDVWVEDFRGYAEAQWADFSHKLPGGESLAEVQARNIAALGEVAKRFPSGTVAIGTHGTALSLIINYFDPTYDRRNFWQMASKMPWCVKLELEDGELSLRCASIEMIDLFDINKVITVCHPLESFAHYRFTVIFAYIMTPEGKRKWLYPRHHDRSTWECAGGRIEKGETPLEGAARELREETGAQSFEITPIFDFTVHHPGGDHEKNIGRNPGQVFLAYIKETGAIPPDSEMAEVQSFDTMPDGELTYPEIYPVLYEKMVQFIETQGII